MEYFLLVCFISIVFTYWFCLQLTLPLWLRYRAHSEHDWSTGNSYSHYTLDTDYCVSRDPSLPLSQFWIIYRISRLITVSYLHYILFKEIIGKHVHITSRFSTGERGKCKRFSTTITNTNSDIAELDLALYLRHYLLFLAG